MFLLKVLTDSCIQKQKIQIKNTFVCHVYKILILKKLNTNGIQAATSETGVIKFKYYEKHLPIPFKIYADSECLFKKTNIGLVNTQNYIKSIYLIL